MRLTRGSSTGEVWEISSDYPEARLTVGSDPGAGWAIQAPGVHAVCCELFWDGQSLWVADTYASGSVFLDGHRVTEWEQIHGPAELRLGQAALDVETSAPLHEQMVSNPRHARPVTLTDMVAPPEDARASRPIFGGAASDESIPDLEGAATRVVASPVVDLDGERTRVASAPVAPPNADLRPRLGGDGGAAHAGEATRMVPMPALPSARPAAPPMAPQARPPQGPTPVVAPPPPPPSSPPSFAPPAPPNLPAHPEAAPLPEAPAGDGSAFVGPPMPPPAAPKESPFGQILQKLKPQSSAEVVQASGGKASQTLPTRTWIMLGVTIAAAVGLLLWEEEPAEVAAPQEQAQAQTAVAVQPREPAQPAQPAQPATPVPQPTAQPAQPDEPAPSPSPPVADGSEGSPAADPQAQGEEGPTMQRRAIDLYIAGQYAQALALYRQLAASDPNDAAYASMVEILEERVRCRDGIGPGGQPCAE